MLNTGASVNITDIDLAPSGADPAEVELAYTELAEHGLLVVGDRFSDEETDVIGRTANQFFLAAPEPE
jgi:hypothetical protein